jgi:predicted RND superfamily exporter protein
MLTKDQAQKLGKAGLDYYNHNLDTGPEYYPEVVNTRTYQDRLDTLAVAREAGMNRFDALVDACHKRSRPIVMTTIAMGAGMLPLALGLSGDPSFRAPMAIAVIGGLITSTLLSLLVVPVVFEKVDDLKEWTLRKLRGARHHEHRVEPASETGQR